MLTTEAWSQPIWRYEGRLCQLVVAILPADATVILIADRGLASAAVIDHPRHTSPARGMPKRRSEPPRSKSIPLGRAGPGDKGNGGPAGGGCADRIRQGERRSMRQVPSGWRV